MLVEMVTYSFYWIGNLTLGLDAELIDPVAIFPSTPTTRAILAGASFRQGVTADRAAEKLIFTWYGGVAAGNRA